MSLHCYLRKLTNLLRRDDPSQPFYHTRRLNDTRPLREGVLVCDAIDRPPHHFMSTRPDQTTCRKCIDRKTGVGLPRPRDVQPVEPTIKSRKLRALGRQASLLDFCKLGERSGDERDLR